MVESEPDGFVCGVELLYMCDIVRHLGTFSFGYYRKDCDVSATLRDIGHLVPYCDKVRRAHGAGKCAPVSEYGAGCGAGVWEGAGRWHGERLAQVYG